MTKQQRIDLALKYINDKFEIYSKELEYQTSLLETMKSFPIYVSLKKKYPYIPSSYEEFLKVRIPEENENEDTPLYEWNLLHQWDINHSFWEKDILSLRIKVDALSRAPMYLKTMMEENDPLLDCPSFYSDFLGALRIGLSSEQLQEFLD